MTVIKCVALFTFFFLPLSIAVAQSSTPGTTAAFAHPRILTDDDLRAFLIATTWTWSRPNSPGDEKIQFFDDGTAHHTYFVARFSIKNTRAVELYWNQHVAKINFDPTYTHYAGTDFEGGRSIQGERIDAPPSTAPTATQIDADAKTILVGNTWQLEAPQFHYKAYRTFNKDGTWSSVNDPMHGSWKILGAKLLVSDSSYPNSPEVYMLPLQKVGWSGVGRSHDPLILGITDPPVRANDEQHPAMANPSYFGGAHP